ncbi:tRNA (adenosine(37)-N6)-threonylcarbamoyltransferase complex dimerization subunit type 1 TsaB [Cellulomonas xiejunii]|uniref:tRNA (Adenosine(37)-N6)-threonylcarbamoyltransferase complex dimerization subunit type 1 TsaB n=1 Tax=Cellulomonas xiejunii TaxID=2968083 RepID=A0ABY5KLB9_9CELL|nr:tRNA (adenosine(37)-N6)-threonylcarbamoyltransferase complex dimerization subunit type 1 TsaB [Cellulomonas xiejunii]MCC2312688.1 tRNA (adenosine(37)-N6)-threonylcarbamoyltransferase complex dimerization subunit type 1 TsaB [Cellulomonas xiejunii]MCC2320442.1 tRNA (adenosine(37)-N6)-threonylcarbamoyltransferase complex dimerization subunit type 1 TsaB [Cellulomonas xiejunii]UUI70738.1 tRNA (adenosine(37)-N6)-threonylcarbamoyltransferase complex dimerization subunit type 1 TsaB [Cellulomonas x
MHLGIDTSGDVAVSVVLDDVNAATLGDDQPRRHAELLAPMIEQLLQQQGRSLREVESIVVGTGPALFTGLRVGLVTARTLGLALGVPVHGVPSLDALAEAAAWSAGLEDGTPLLVVTDARRREVYWSRYEVRGRTAAPVAGPDVAAPGDVPRTPDDVVLGAARDLYPQTFAEPDPRLHPGTPMLRSPDPSLLVRVALRRLAAGETLPADPLYLRRPDAVPSTGSKRVLA